jgi:hypothetical protein
MTQTLNPAMLLLKSLRLENETAVSFSACLAIKIRAQRKAGELLAVMDKNPGGQAEHESYTLQPERTRPKLSDIGVDHTQSHRWQQLAAIAEYHTRTLAKKPGPKTADNSVANDNGTRPIDTVSQIVGKGTATVSKIKQ